MKIGKISGRKFIRHCNSKFGLLQEYRRISDYRTAPEISLDTILMSTSMGSIIGSTSINSLDQLLKQEEPKRFFHSSREMVTSASTIRRTYYNIDTEQMRTILYNSAENIIEQKRHIGLKGKTIGSVDGSRFGKWSASVLQLCGQINTIADFEPCYGRGQEYTATIRLLKRALLEALSIDIGVADGLYLKTDYFNLFLDNDSHGLVKYKPEEGKRLPNILNEANEIFDNFPDKIYTEEELDLDRSINYKIECCGGFHKEGVKSSLFVMRVKEEPATKSVKCAKLYYIVTTYPLELAKKDNTDEITPYDARELGKGAARWAIEINGFKQLNQLFNSQHGFFQDKKAWENLLCSIFTINNIFNDFVYDLILSKQDLITVGKFSVKLVLQRLIISFYIEVQMYSLRYDSS